MTEDEIIAEIRREIREPKPKRYSNTRISAVIVRGVAALGLIIKEAAPSEFTKKKVLQSQTHVFSKPSDHLTTRNIWDIGTTATAVEAASTDSPINITITGHGWSDDNIVFIDGVHSSANGMRKITVVDDDNFTLNGTVGTSLTYTSGGLAFLVNMGVWQKVTRKNPERASLSDRYRWYPEGQNIVVDWISQTNDLLIDYIYRPTEVSDIPSDFHDGLVSYGVKNLIYVPEPEDPTYQDVISTLSEHRANYKDIVDRIKVGLRPSGEIVEFNITDGIDWDGLTE